MLRAGIVAIALLLVLWAACSDENEPGPAGTAFPSDNDTPSALVTPVTPVPKPPGVPEPASAITQTTTLGHIERRAGEEPQAVMIRLLSRAVCSDGVMTFSTSEETIYAETLQGDCTAFWEDEQSSLFVEAQVAIELKASSTRFRIFFETLEGAQAEFTVTGIWVEAP